MQFKGKLEYQTSENGQKPNFGPNWSTPPSPRQKKKKKIGGVLPPLDVRYCRELSLHAIFRKMKNPNSVKWWETSFFIFFKNLTSSVTRYHVQLSSCTISEKTNDPILRKKWQTRVISWHGSTNVEHPI